MANILFASNSISHFPGTEIKTIAGNNSWEPFDSSRVPYAIYTVPNTEATSPEFTESTTTETWAHCRFGVTFWDFNTSEQIFALYNDTTLIAQIFYRPSNGYEIKHEMDGQSQSIFSFMPLQYELLRSMDIRVIHDSGNSRSELELYVNEIFMGKVDFIASNIIKPNRLRIGNHKDGAYFSEIIVADGDTRNARLDLVVPVAEGHYKDWNGSLGALSDDDPTTGMTTTLTDQKQSTIMTPYGGASNISNVVQVTTSVRGINSPDQLEHFLRMGAVDYSNPVPFDLTFSKEFQVTDWQINPATSQPWTAADIAATEFGFGSKNST